MQFGRSEQPKRFIQLTQKKLGEMKKETIDGVLVWQEYENMNLLDNFESWEVIYCARKR